MITDALYESTGHHAPFTDAQAEGHRIAHDIEQSGQDSAQPGTALVAQGEVQTVTKLGLLPPMKKLAPRLFKVGGGALAVTMIVASEIDLGRYVYARLLVDSTAPTSIDYDYEALSTPATTCTGARPQTKTSGSSSTDPE